MARLFTKEDPYNFHKTFGLLSLLSFLFRYAYVYPKYGNLGFHLNDPISIWLNIFTVFVHLTLSCSSLVFRVLKMRLMQNPMIIWEEYRLHAVVFTLRCFTVIMISWFTPNCNEWVRFCAVLGWHVIADIITHKFGKPDEFTTVRVKDDYGLGLKIVLRFYAFYQFIAGASQLLPHDRAADAGWNAIIAIQSSAFLMTLCRKGIISSMSHGIGYTLCLFLSAFHVFKLFPNPIFLLSVLAVFTTRLNVPAIKIHKWDITKYILWSLFLISHIYGSRINHFIVHAHYTRFSVLITIFLAQVLAMLYWLPGCLSRTYNTSVAYTQKVGGNAIDKIRHLQLMTYNMMILNKGYEEEVPVTMQENIDSVVKPKVSAPPVAEISTK